jgi:hypothetical protein
VLKRPPARRDNWQLSSQGCLETRRLEVARNGDITEALRRSGLEHFNEHLEHPVQPALRILGDCGAMIEAVLGDIEMLGV